MYDYFNRCACVYPRVYWLGQHNWGTGARTSSITPSTSTSVCPTTTCAARKGTAPRIPETCPTAHGVASTAGMPCRDDVQRNAGATTTVAVAAVALYTDDGSAFDGVDRSLLCGSCIPGTSEWGGKCVRTCPLALPFPATVTIACALPMACALPLLRAPLPRFLLWAHCVLQPAVE